MYIILLAFVVAISTAFPEVSVSHSSVRTNITNTSSISNITNNINVVVKRYSGNSWVANSGYSNYYAYYYQNDMEYNVTTTTSWDQWIYYGYVADISKFTNSSFRVHNFTNTTKFVVLKSVLKFFSHSIVKHVDKHVSFLLLKMNGNLFQKQLFHNNFSIVYGQLIYGCVLLLHR